MNIYYHHVGQTGASADFPKTVYSPITLSFVAKNISAEIGEKPMILDELAQRFVNGEFNCWGVPAGARNVIRNLEPNDMVLLIETTAGDGSIPAMGQVVSFWNIELRELSLALWGNHKYPYIFFFETERINLPWTHFIEHVGYKPNYRPSGNFLSIKSNRLKKFGGPEKYIKHIRSNYRSRSRTEALFENDSEYIITRQNIPDSIMPNELEDISNHESSIASLTQTEQESIVKSRIGQGKFRQQLISYWGGCAVTRCQELSILRASHIKPWRESTNEERLDIYNGLLLIPNLDILFDQGFISFQDDGTIMISSRLDESSRDLLNVQSNLHISKLVPPHSEFLAYHRNNVFKP